MRREQVLPIFAVASFGAALILMMNDYSISSLFTGAGFLTLAVHRRTFNKGSRFNNLIPFLFGLIGVYYIVIFVF